MQPFNICLQITISNCPVWEHMKLIIIEVVCCTRDFPSARESNSILTINNLCPTYEYNIHNNTFVHNVYFIYCVLSTCEYILVKCEYVFCANLNVFCANVNGSYVYVNQFWLFMYMCVSFC